MTDGNQTGKCEIDKEERSRLNSIDFIILLSDSFTIDQIKIRGLIAFQVIFVCIYTSSALYPMKGENWFINVIFIPLANINYLQLSPCVS